MFVFLQGISYWWPLGVTIGGIGVGVWYSQHLQSPTDEEDGRVKNPSWFIAMVPKLLLFVIISIGMMILGAHYLNTMIWTMLVVMLVTIICSRKRRKKGSKFDETEAEFWLFITAIAIGVGIGVGIGLDYLNIVSSIEMEILIGTVAMLAVILAVVVWRCIKVWRWDKELHKIGRDYRGDHDLDDDYAALSSFYSLEEIRRMKSSWGVNERKFIRISKKFISP